VFPCGAKSLSKFSGTSLPASDNVKDSIGTIRW
jgi:hypothetical protein